MANPTRNVASFRNLIRLGDETRIKELADYKFTDVVLEDGTLLKDITFDQLIDSVWTRISRNTATFTQPTRN